MVWGGGRCWCHSLSTAQFRNTSTNSSEEHTKLQKEFTSYLAIASNVPNALFVILNVLYGRRFAVNISRESEQILRFNLNLRLIAALSVMATLLVGVLLMTRWVQVEKVMEVGEAVEVVVGEKMKVMEEVVEGLTATLGRIDSDDWQEWFLVSTLSIVVLLNICTAIFQGGLIGATFPSSLPPLQGCAVSSRPPTWGG